MASIVTYDVPEKHDELKRALFQLGYLAQITDPTCKIIYLPNTTVYHSSKTPFQSKEDVKAICARLQIELERCVATVWSGWAAICGKPFNNR